jgi:uncharacterized membrane protein
MVSKYFLWFIIYSFMGWVYETFVMTIYEKKWDNRGFLFGPWLPIYGIGALLISIIVEQLQTSGILFYWYHIFLISFFGSIVLEFSTSWLLEKLFSAYWWDYSNVPFNVQGRICLPASLGFGLAGEVVVYIIYPFVSSLTTRMSPTIIEILALLFMSLISVDTALTSAILISVEKRIQALDESVNQNMEIFVESLQERMPDTKSVVSGVLTKLNDMTLNRFVRGLGSCQRSVLKRVSGFHKPSINTKLVDILRIIKDNETLQKVLERVEKKSEGKETD